MRPLIGDAEDRLGEEPEGRAQLRRQLERQAVLAARDRRQLRGQDRSGGGDRQRDHREEDRAHAQRQRGRWRTASTADSASADDEPDARPSSRSGRGVSSAMATP